ncbi:MAG: hypothetical protein WCX12_02390 [Candidatus Paceibacterota bacterium]|jgi:hypothetical protein
MPREYLQIVKREIREAVEAISELGLKGKKSVTVLFPSEITTSGLLEFEIVSEVTGLFIGSKRTDRVRRRLAESIGKAIGKRFSGTKVECLIYPFDPKDGFWSSEE